MKIIHLVLRPRFSGAEILVRDLCRVQKEMGHEVVFASMDPSEDSFVPELCKLRDKGVQIEVPLKRLSKLGRLLSIRELIRKHRPDQIFAHSVLPAIYARLALLPRREVSVVLHAASNDDFAEGKLRRIEMVLSHFARDVIAVSEIGCQNYATRFPNAVAPRLVKNGIDFSEAEAHARTRGNHISGRTILQVGRVAPVKGQDLSIAAIKEVLPEFPNVKLLMAGLIESDVYYQRLKDQVLVNNLQENVEFLGPRSDIFHLLSEADIYVMPSHAESQGIAMLEALAVGVPIVANNLDVFREFDGMPGVDLIDTSDVKEFARSIARLLHSADRTYSRNLGAYDIMRTAHEYIGTKQS